MQKFHQHVGLSLRTLAGIYSIAMVCFQITVSSTLADTPQQLVAKLQQEKMNADEMIACESALKASSAAKVLPLLLPLVSQGMPEGPIWNSGGVKIDINAPLDWRVFYSSSRVWNHLAKQNPKLAGELLADALVKAESGREKKALLGRLSANWNDSAEPIAAEILRNWKKEPEAWMAAAYCLASRHREKYDDLFSRVLTELPDKTLARKKHDGRLHSSFNPPPYQGTHGFKISRQDRQVGSSVDESENTERWIFADRQRGKTACWWWILPRVGYG